MSWCCHSGCRTTRCPRGQRLFLTFYSKYILNAEVASNHQKVRLFSSLAQVGKALASPVRLQLVDLLAQGDRTVEALAIELDLPVANVSHHLQVLREGGLLASRREGSHVRYRLVDEDAFRLYRMLRDVAARHLEEMDRAVRSYLGGEGLEAISREELSTRLRAGEIIVLDVRPEVEYRAGHLPSARSIPVRELASRLAELPRGVPVVAYCRGPFCVYAVEAVRLLRRHGREAIRLADGFPEWQAAGLAVERG